jgi:hypothetical protein
MGGITIGGGGFTAANQEKLNKQMADKAQTEYDQDMAKQSLFSGQVSGDEANPDKMYEKRLIAYVKGDNRAAGMDFEPKPEDAKTANALHEEAVSKKKGGKIKKYSQGGSTAGAGRGGQGGPTAEQMAERNSPNYMTPETERQLKAERDERLQQAKINEAYEAATQNKKKGGKITHYKSAAAAVKAAEKRGDKSITVKFNHRDGIAQRGHTKGRMR